MYMCIIFLTCWPNDSLSSIIIHKRSTMPEGEISVFPSEILKLRVGALV